MRSIVALIVGLVIPTGMRAQVPDLEAPVRQAVQAFYNAFNSDGFDRAPDFTTEDWNHISPLGGRTRGRAATVARVEQVHSTFLKGVSETIERMDVRFATAEVAVVTVTSHATAFTSPDGVKHENQRQIRTFVVVKRANRWLIMQDHATYVTEQPAVRP